jgi:hypothetical protein
MNRTYGKPKDKLFAHVLVILGFVFVPLSILWAAVQDIGAWLKELRNDFRREFKGGLRVTYRYAFNEVMDHLAGRRARRERRRAVINAPL